jgi:ATP-binding cassette subfamily B protein RaxB
MSGASWRLNFAGRRRLPVIRQSEIAECGLACLAMVASYHGHQITLNQLRLGHRLSLSGTTLKDLIDIASRLGMSSRPLRLGTDSLGKLRTPCILHWGMNHFVVLRKVTSGTCRVHDPACGDRQYSLDEVSAKFTGIALEMRPAAEFARRDDRQQMRLSDLWGKIVGLRMALVQTLVLSVIVQLFSLAAPFYMQLVVDEVLTRFDTDLLLLLAMGFGLLLLINTAADALRAYVILYLGNMLGFHMVSNLFRHLLRLPLSWYEKRHVGDILSRFSSTDPIRDLLTRGLVATVIDGLMTISTLLLMFVYSPLLGSVALLVATAYVLLRLIMYEPLRRRNEEQIITMAHERSAFIESIRGILSIKIFGNEAQREALWQNRYADVINSSVGIGKLKIGFDAASGLLFGLENTLIVYLAATLAVQGSLTVGMIFAFMAYKRHFVEKVRLLVERLIEFRLLGLHLERIADIGLAPVERGHPQSRGIPAHTLEKRAGPGELQLDRVSFRYADGEARILEDLSLTIKGGEMLSIVGASGCGKTTLMKLLLGLFEPEAGQILYKGLPLGQFGMPDFRRRIGTVMQDDALLTGTIAENIAFFDSDTDMPRVQRCAEDAAIHSDIMSMPMRYDSLVGDMGDTLSAGQRQRVLLARALYRQPEILILDEGTANLDPMTEDKIVKLLGRLTITRICVAHRRALLRASDRIVHLKGRTVHA